MSSKLRTRAAVTAGLCAALTLSGAATVLADPIESGAVDAAVQNEDSAPSATAVASLKGEGTKENPYQISSADELAFMAEKVNAGDVQYASACYKLTDHIDLSGREWTPIGTKGKEFKGTFDGAGFIVSGLAINDSALELAGLFGKISSPARIVGVAIQGANITAKASAGALAGSAFTGSIEECRVTGVVKIEGNYKVGGLVGEGYATIKNCSVDAERGSSVVGTYKERDLEGDNVGGLVGYRGEGAGIVTENCSVSNLAIAGSRKVGGIVGSAFVDNTYADCSVSNCSLTCNAPYEYGLSVKNQLAVGGIVGMFSKSGNAKGALTNCKVSNISMDVEDDQLASEGYGVLGLVSGGYRVSSFSSSVSAPDNYISVDGFVIEGANTGENASIKYPGSVAMNGKSIFEKGQGTAEDPFLISSLEDLQLLREVVNSTGVGFSGQCFKVADSVSVLDISGEKWTSIGTSSHKFAGSFNGNGVVIKGLNDGGKSETYGLFGYINGAVISNVIFEDVDLSYGSGSYRGAVAGYLYGTNTIENITVSGSIAGNDYVGGIAGKPLLNANNPGTLTIRGCVNAANIEGKDKIGGVVGYARADVAGTTKVVVENCRNTGAVSGAQYIGGIAGWAYNAEIKSCVNSGVLESAASDSSVGGIVGNANQNVTVSDCVNNADINGADVVGGIIGTSNSGNAIVSKCANSGSVAGVNNVAGIIGGTAASGDAIDNCYNSGVITASGDSATVAGIYAYNNSSCDVKACYNIGSLNSTGASAKKYQIGKSGYWYDQATGSKILSCYYKEDGKIYKAAENGEGEGALQDGMTSQQLADALNVAGGVSGYWVIDGADVIPGDYADDLEAKVVATVGGVPYSSVQEAVEAATGYGDSRPVKLEVDVATSSTIEIAGDVTIDLSGHSITANDTRAIHVKSGKLTLTGKGAVTTVIPTGGKLPATSSVIRVGDSTEKGGGNNDIAAALLIDKDVTISAPNTYGVGAFGDKTKETIEVRGTIKSVVNSALGGNGSAGLGETDFTVTNTATLITTNTYAIYHPQAGTLKIDGATIEGKGGIEAKGGTITISGNATITATAEKTSHNPYSNGPSTDGYAIAAVANKNYAGAPKFEISSATVTGKVATEVDDGATEDKKGAISITGGTYSENPSAFVASDDYVVSESGGKWTVSEKPVTPPSGGGGSTAPSDKTEVEKNPDGSTTTTVTKPDGSQTITHETATGTESVVKKDEDGNVTSTEVTVSKTDAESGKVELPIEGAEPAADVDKAQTVEVKVPSSVTAERPVQVTVPVSKGEGDEPNYGIVVFAVDAEGDETVIPKCTVDDDGNVVFEAAGDVTIKVVDNAKEMPDVTDSDWFAGDVVDFATARGIVNGVDMPDGTKQFQGYGRTSRGMFVAMLHNLELNPKAASDDSLADVPEGAFYADAAAWALEEGILSGVDMPDGSKQFQGETAVTREQVAVFLMRYAEHLGMDVSERAEIDFPDASEVSSFAKDAMGWAVAEGLFKGDDATGELNPADGAARAEVATVLMRFINMMYA